MPDFSWKQGDTGPALTDTLQYSDGSVVNLESPATVSLRLRSTRDASLIALTGSTTITSIDGGVMFVPSVADTSNPPGNYMAEWVVTRGASVQTFPTDGFLWGRIEMTAASAPQLIVSLPDVKEHLGIDANNRARDAKILRLIEVVTPLIESVVGPVIPRVFEEWHDGGGAMISLLNRPSSALGMSPVMTLLAASEYRGPVEYPLALVPSPAFGSIYSVFLDPALGTVTRRAPGGSTIPFSPGNGTVHLVYQAGQASVPASVEFAALEAVRVAYSWPQQTGAGSRSFADEQESGPSLQFALTRMIRTVLAPSRRAPSFA